MSDADRFLRQYEELMLMIDDAGFTVGSGKLERKTHNIEFPSMKKTPIEASLESRISALEKAIILTQGYTCRTCGYDAPVKPNCIAHHDVRPHDVVKQLAKRIEAIEAFVKANPEEALAARAQFQADERRRDAEPCNMPGPIVLEFLAWLRSGLPPKLAAQIDEDEALCAAFFAQRIEAKR